MECAIRPVRRLLPALLLLLLAGCAAHRAAPPAVSAPIGKPEIVRRVLPSVIELVYEEHGTPVRYASGVVVGAEDRGPDGRGPRSWVLTSAHAVLGPTVEHAALVIRHHDAQDAIHRASGAVVAFHEASDLALVRVDGVQLPAVDLDGGDGARLGDEIVVIGTPFGRGLSVSSGIVSQLAPRQPDGTPSAEPLLKVDAPVGYGSSGGGVFQVRTGRLLGIVEGYRTATVSLKLAGEPYSFQVPMPGETFVVRSGEIRRFLRERGFGRLLAD